MNFLLCVKSTQRLQKSYQKKRKKLAVARFKILECQLKPTISQLVALKHSRTYQTQNTITQYLIFQIRIVTFSHSQICFIKNQKICGYSKKNLTINMNVHMDFLLTMTQHLHRWSTIKFYQQTLGTMIFCRMNFRISQ